MSSIGHIIKSERINQSMKQTTLAKGICSTSYLSKIENNLTVPSDEVITFLLKKLNIEIDQVSSEKENKIITSLSELYKTAVLKRDKKFIRESLHKFTYQKLYFLQLNNYYSYHLYLFRLLLILDDEEDKLQSTYNIIVKIRDDIDEKQKFINNLNLGIYSYLEGNYQDALSRLEMSLEYVNNGLHEEWEIADFYNVLSLTYSKCDEFFNAINYASKSLLYYKDNLLFERAIDNYIVIGIAHKEMRKFQEAEKNYNLARKLAIDYKLINYEEVIYQNLGSLHAIQGSHEKAIEFYKLSLKIKEEDCNAEGYLLTTLSIIKQYSKQSDHQQVLKWCQKGLDKIVEGKNSKKEYISYYYHLEIYKHYHNLTDELEMVLREAISYFENEKDERHVQKYSILLADYLFKHHKFKAASLYYQKANKILFKQKFIVKWEDL
ncbi:helix-turn-helix transcriptional regulator [Psychrobacillus sp. INOP01]|uniref:helix-turn-helix domain-containing protein n=1 Tax=Psychrobacillus sp. INOP01 TaxID=2829187 RepID=UPI001BABAE4B|nr:helix-turn-helix transcriptional regulator [Psychrobacillus sp. INOP01]QUG43625.1 helix-turn-helix transcriptional regulator [Psychrobacillus sp. INOP01]